MKRLLSLAPGAILIVALFLLPVSGALAQVTITPGISPVAYDVCGNAVNKATGDCVAVNGSNGNTVTVQNGATVSAGWGVYGKNDTSMTRATAAASNHVFIYGAVDTVMGGEASSTASGFNATVTNNQATASGAGASVAGDFYGGQALSSGNATARAESNGVLVELGAAVAGSTFGGYAYCFSGNCVAQVVSNTAAITGGTATDLYGGFAVGATTATASGNTVSITGGTVSGSILGGLASTALTGTAAIASGNTVSITGGTVENGYIYGGFADSPTPAALGNTVNIGGNANIGPGISLYGGYASNGGPITNNTLNLALGGVTVDYLLNFQNLNFQVPAGLGAAAMLTVTDTATVFGATLSTGAKISVTVSGPIKIGDTIVLIDAKTALFGMPDSAVISPQGYGFQIDQTELANNRLVVKVTSMPPVPTLNPMVLALLALLLAGVAAATQRRMATMRRGR
ncbi:MAG: IPTL-CTERM sorting domain-containing protein [Betaproteobacteria bacterium]|nr:IPTL-CTERM sorting domain-containing protein [Betaproteobacteria bacterium]